MKNLLIATTALVATAGVAAAEINFSGGARFGIRYDESAVDGIQESKITNRMTINIDGTAETDTGVEFFGRVRIRGGNTGNGATGVLATNTTPAASGVSAPRVGARIGGLTVATGNIAGAIDALPGLYSGSVGLTGLSYSNVVVGGGYDSFSSAGGGQNGVEVIYSANGLGVHLSHSDVVRAAATAATRRTALGVSYAFGDWNVALGLQSGDATTDDYTVLSATGTVGSVALGLQYADNDANTGGLRVSAGFDVGAATNVTVFVADRDAGAGPDTAYGIGFTHSLGGATLAGGLVSSATGTTSADMGVRFEF
jgi:outer membrane protein OmpU